MIERKQIPVSDLTIDTAQSRRGEWEADEQDQRLVHSLETDGLLQSLLVRPIESTGYDADSVDADYSIIAGSRRYHAAVEAGFESVHCRVIDADDFEAAKKSLKENEERKDLSDQEVARSIKMQFEIKRPEPPWECPDCGDVFEESELLNHHMKMSASCGAPRRYIDGGRQKFYTLHSLYDFLRQEHLGRATDSQDTSNIRKLIRVAELPDELQALWKRPEMRTVDEKEALDKFNIERDLNAEADSGLSMLGTEVVNLHQTIDQQTDSDAINSTNATLEALGRLDVGNMKQRAMNDELRRFRQELKEVGDIEEPDEQERAFRSKLEARESALHDLNETLDGASIGQLNFRLNDQRYKRYHARARQTLGAESDAEVVRKGYRRYLEQQAEKHDW